MKNIRIASLLTIFVFGQIFSVTTRIDDDTYISPYEAECDESAIRAMHSNLYELEDGLKDQYSSKLKSLEFAAFQKKIVEDYDPASLEDSLVLIHKDKTIGFCIYDIDLQTGDLHIYMFAIDKNFRRDHYGEKFLNKIIEVLRVPGNLKSITLCAHPVTNSAAIKLYKKIGFEEVGEKGNLLKFSKKFVD